MGPQSVVRVSMVFLGGILGKTVFIQVAQYLPQINDKLKKKKITKQKEIFAGHNILETVKKYAIMYLPTNG